MKKFSQIKKLFTLAAVALGLAITALTTANVSALSWGDSLNGRTTFTTDNPASYPVMNSITDNVVIGDERYFVRVGEYKSTGTTVGTDTVSIVPGKKYVVYIYYHNNASSTLNSDGSGFAEGVRVATAYPTVITKGETLPITATISMVVPAGRESVAPEKVWAGVDVTTTYDKVFLSYDTASAKIYNQTGTNGTTLSTNLFTQEGTLIGSDRLNGWIYACEQFQGYVMYILEAKSLDGTIEKTVSADGEAYGASVNAKENDELHFKLTIKNAGSMALTNAVVKDSLPDGLTLVPGSVELSANDSTVKDPLSDNLIGTGYNLGTIGTDNVVYITYRAKVGKGFDCGELKLTNTATLVYDSNTSAGDTDTSSANVLVNKDGCELPTEIANTGPLEIVMAVVIVLGISGGGFYLYRTRRTLRAVKNEVSGSNTNENIVPDKTSDDANKISEDADKISKHDDKN